ncbi:MAG: YedE-related selenium metabolism membrane protein [Oscillospiraceae bacterium]|nr:YedE-related selenium metabolism membrane protein [Oscillospiraceae bacterium]
MKKQNWLKQNWLVILCGLLVGTAAVVLTKLGNPGNMGFCIACFLRDIAGALGLQGATGKNEAGEVVRSLSNFRPEIVGIIVGACILALITKEFKPKGGSSPFTRFILGIFVMFGALVFLGCPLRMAIRIGGGDMNAIMGLIGFVVGILVGILVLKGGFSLGRAYKQSKVEGLAFPVIMVGLFVLSLVGGDVLFTSGTTPGNKFAPWAIALVIAIVVGALAQKSRLCFVGGVRDAVMFKEFGLLAGFGGVIVAVMLGNIIVGNSLTFKFDGQPIAHTEWLWNMLGMTLVGWGCVLLGGCPLRQLVLAGEGNTDSAVTVMGMLVGGGLAHTLSIASTGAGTNTNGPAAVIIGLVVVLAVSLTNMKKGKA